MKVSKNVCLYAWWRGDKNKKNKKRTFVEYLILPTAVCLPACLSTRLPACPLLSMRCSSVYIMFLIFVLYEVLFLILHLLFLIPLQEASSSSSFLSSRQRQQPRRRRRSWMVSYRRSFKKKILNRWSDSISIIIRFFFVFLICVYSLIFIPKNQGKRSV